MDELDGTVADWSDMTIPRPLVLLLARLLLRVLPSGKILRRLYIDGSALRLGRFLAKIIALNETARALAFLSEYDQVVTDRLHGVLLAKKIGIPILALDNDHGKISRYLETWHYVCDDNTGVPLCSTLAEAVARLAVNRRAL